MISEKLLKLYHTALQMETLLQASNKQYRAMYAALEHDLDISLDGVAQRMIVKYNIPNQQVDTYPGDMAVYPNGVEDDYELPDEGPDLVPEDSHDSSD